jgi:4-amino-4-deoxy-L-arabinose transferase-like glycosyltransferase
MAIVTSGGSVAASQVAEPKNPLKRHLWHQDLTILIPIMTVYFCLAFYRIDQQSFWVDEVLSLRRADPAGAFLARDRWSSGHGPLYFRLLHLWAAWGTNEFALRSLSVLFGGLAVGLVYVMGRQLYDRRLAGMGATLMATSPFLIWYSQEVRYITLMIAAALFAMYTFHRALGARRLAWWLLHCGSLILAIAAFVVNIFLPLAQGLYLICSPFRRPMLRKWVLSQLVVFALFAWWANDTRIDRLGGYWRRVLVQATTSDAQVSTVPSRERLVTGGAREFTLMALPYTFFTFSAGFSLGPSVRELQVSRSLTALSPHALVLSFCGLLFGSLFVVGLAALRRQPDSAKFLAAWLAVPILITLGISALIPEMAYNVRYVAMCLPAFLLILAVGIASFRRPLVQVALLAAVLLINGLSLAHYYFDPRYSREDARSAARYLETAAHSGDVIVTVGSHAAFKHYYKGEVPVVGLGKAVINDGVALAERIGELGATYDRLWLVSLRSWQVDKKGIVRAMIDNRYGRIERRELSGVEIDAYQLR